MVKISTFEYMKKRWLLYISYLFIYVLPGALIIEKMVTIKSNENDVTVSFFGFILGLVYVVFILKKLKAKLSEMKPSAFKKFITTVFNTIPFATVGCLIILVENSLSGFDTIVWYVCGSMLLGAVMQAVEFSMNKRFLYNLEIEELARKQVDVEKKKRELLEELNDELS